MIEPRVESAIHAAIAAYTDDRRSNSQALAGRLRSAFDADAEFLNKVAELDAVIDAEMEFEPLREVFFDLLLINFFSEDVKKLEDDYLETKEWELIEEETLDRGTELLNVLLYLNECSDEGIEPELDDYLKEFLLIDEDEFQDEVRIYEPVIANQILLESPVAEIGRMAAKLPEDAELKTLFYPMMCFFHSIETGEDEQAEVAKYAPDRQFDLAVFAILQTFNSSAAR